MRHSLAGAAEARHSTPVIVTTTDLADLELILDSDVQAVICTLDPPPTWCDDLEAALRIRAVAPIGAAQTDGDRDGVARWLEWWLADAIPDPRWAHLRASVREDVLGLADVLAQIGGVTRFRLRALISAPSTECGFHVDTVPPGATNWGLLRVYNGAPTQYVEAQDLGSVGDFHRYLHRRERLERTRAAARRDGLAGEIARIEAAIADLDAAKPFLHAPAAVHEVPPDSIVAFRHADVRDHWSERPAAAGWVHCSPTTGRPRLVFNLTSPQWAPPSARPAGTALPN